MKLFCSLLPTTTGAHVSHPIGPMFSEAGPQEHDDTIKPRTVLCLPGKKIFDLHLVIGGFQALLRYIDAHTSTDHSVH